jgi:hypothetical protein
MVATERGWRHDEGEAPRRRSGRSSRWLAASGLAAAALTVADQTRAGNGDTFYLGNDAAMLGGAAVAAGRGAGATWYNPARLAVDDDESAEVSASAYVVRFGGAADIAAPPGFVATRQRLSSLDIGAVPTALAIRREVLGFAVGAGVFVPARTISYPRTLLKQQRPDGSEASEVAVDGNERESEYYAGLALARDLGRRLRLGGALYGYYSSSVETSVVGLRRPDSGAFLVSGGTVDAQRVGCQGVVGFTWEVHSGIEVAFVLRSPVLQVGSVIQTTQLLATGSANAGGSTLVFEERPLGVDPLLIAPLRAEFGTAFAVTPRTTAAADVRLRGPLNRAVDRGSEAVVNLRAGLRHELRGEWLIGGGVFTDRSPARARDTGATTLDFYGATAGITFGNPYRVTSENDPRPRTLAFSTTIAFSYSLGLGEVTNVAIVPRRQQFDVAPLRHDATAHELMLHIGSTLSTSKPASAPAR